MMAVWFALQAVRAWLIVLRSRWAGGPCAGLMVPGAEIARAAGGMDQAYLLKRIRQWAKSNEDRSKMHYYRQGQWWCVQSYKQWSEDLTWLSEGQVRDRLKDLEARGLIVITRWVHGGVNGYRVDEDALARALTPAKMVRFSQRTASDFRQTPFDFQQTPSDFQQTPFGKRHDESDKESDHQSIKEGDQSNPHPPATRIDGLTDLETEKDELIRQFGASAVNEAIEAAERFSARHPLKYAARVLANRAKRDPSLLRRASGDDGRKYISGKYADFVEY